MSVLKVSLRQAPRIANAGLRSPKHGFRSLGTNLAWGIDVHVRRRTYSVRVCSGDLLGCAGNLTKLFNPPGIFRKIQGSLTLRGIIE